MKAMARIAALRAELSRPTGDKLALANLDGLTGLFNRRYMDQRLDEAVVVLSREAPLWSADGGCGPLQAPTTVTATCPATMPCARWRAPQPGRRGANAEGLQEAFVAR